MRRHLGPGAVEDLLALGLERSQALELRLARTVRVRGRVPILRAALRVVADRLQVGVAVARHLHARPCGRDPQPRAVLLACGAKAGPDPFPAAVLAGVDARMERLIPGGQLRREVPRRPARAANSLRTARRPSSGTSRREAAPDSRPAAA